MSKLTQLADFLQSGGGIPESQIEKFFSKYDSDNGILESVWGPAIERFNSGTLPSEQAPFDPNAEPVFIERMRPMPVGQGSWFNRHETPASLQALETRGQIQGEEARREMARIDALIRANPDEFGPLTAADFGTVKEANSYLQMQKAQKMNQSKLQETIRKNKAREDIQRRKNIFTGKPSPLPYESGEKKNADYILKKFRL